MTARRHLLCEIEGLPRGIEYFFGSPVRLRMRESKARRVTPASLCTLPYQSRSLVLRVFQYCPETGERLISNCPNCGKLLGWTRTVGVEFCEHCLSDENDPTTDLRRATADRLAMRDLRLYSQVAGLIVPRQIRTRLHPPNFFDGLPGKPDHNLDDDFGAAFQLLGRVWFRGNECAKSKMS